MADDLQQLLEKLTPDQWRATHPFEKSVRLCSEQIYALGDDKEKIAAELGAWLFQNQPCLFGRIAVMGKQIGYCVVTETDIALGSKHVHDVIQQARTAWTRNAFAGRQSGFVVAVISKRIAEATPDAALRDLSIAICSQYLERDIVPDQIFHETVVFEKPGEARSTWQWNAGVNYFCANADGRWWQDHRIPAGLAFSVNSVGHMAKSGAFAKAQALVDQLVGGDATPLGSKTVDNLDKALQLAMKTIDQASDAVSGKATWLNLASDPPQYSCPIALTPDIQGKDHCTYSGYYHTDVTIPSVYFRPDVERPADQQVIPLDFTYLFAPGPANLDAYSMGGGRRMRSTGVALDPRQVAKLAKLYPTEVPIDQCERLRAAGIT